jgi:hypothetical protein
MRATKAKLRIARARLRHPEDVAPGFMCCEAMRKSTARIAGKIIEIYPDQSYRECRKCPKCGKSHEITGLRMVERVRNCEMVAAEWVDIDEGVAQ